ncbi:two-component regulator propeller domain-containing protein [Pararcticibacter amylolyticus]|nr:two-component regulator propeller domain-containing protein [Pararcticibacter amylolyticus]
MKIYMRILFLFIALFQVLFLAGQPPTVKYLSLQEGLSNQQVLDLAQDESGFVWIATELGLNRFASNSFKQYYKSEKADGVSVNSNEINTLFYNNGQLYIGTRANGLNVLNLQTNRFSYYLHDPNNNKSIATNDITDIIKGEDGYLWLATYHQGIQRFDPVKKEFEHFNKKRIPSLPENSIWSLAFDQQGLMYVGHVGKGLSVFHTRSGKVEVLNKERTNGMLPDDEVKALFCDSKNNIWIGTRKGLAVYNPLKRSIQSISLVRQVRQPFVYSIKEIDGAIWVGAESSQLFIVKPEYGINKDVRNVRSVIPFNLDKGTNSSVQHIAADSFGNIWLAVYGVGVGVVSHLKPFFKVFPGEGMSAGSFGKLTAVSGILLNNDNSMWLATVGNGVVQMKEGEGLKYPSRANGGADDFLLSAFCDRKNNKWFGLQSGGVAVFNSEEKRWQQKGKLENMTEVRAMIEDSHGQMWFAAQEGLFTLVPEQQKWQKLIINNPMLGDYAPRALVEDSRGYIWAGTYGQGLYVFNRDLKLVRKISKDDGLKSNTINHLFRDHRNNIWIATNEGIAVQYVSSELGRIENIVPPGSDAWLIVNAIAQDRSGNLWCSTKSGLLRYLPEERRFLSYDRAFGLPLGGFVNNSVAVDHKGRMFFGMPGGVCYFDPGEIPLKIAMSSIMVSRFTVFNNGESHTQSEKYPSLAQEILLNHDENSFRIELAVMDYALNDLVEFSYKLQGLDEDWIFMGSEKNLDFRNIPYGKYELRIRTRQKNENWPDNYKRLFIVISPPFYLSPYAFVFYGLLVATIVFVVVFFYIKKIKAEAELRLKKHQLVHDEKLYTERLNFFTNITHELRTPLTLILGPLHDLLNEDKLSSRHRDLVQTVQKSANRLFALVSQLLEFRKVESQYKQLVLGEGFIGEMLQEIVAKYAESNSKKAFSISCIVPRPDVKTSFDAEIVQLVMDNLLSNACKYTSAGSIEVRLEYEQDRLSTWAVIYVKDSGCGIAPEYLDKIFDKFYQVPRSAMQGTGVGLALVRELVAIHHGKILVKSEPEKGSEFCVRLLTNAVATGGNEKDESLSFTDGTHHVDGDHSPLLLLVEDDTDLREYLTSLLRHRYEIISAENGSSGFDMATNRIPDLILSDIVMPDMDGFGMLKKLKQERETSHIPIIFLTAKDGDTDRQHGYELGVDSYLTKPVSAQLLYQRIENLLLKRKETYAEVLAQLSVQNEPETARSGREEELWRENAFVREFVSLVEECILDEVLDAATLAEKMNMSQSTLYRKLKGLTGKNINQLVRKVRIQKAAELLRSGQYNVTEVSFMVGINSSIYFRQCFKEEFGLLPSEYQKEALNSKQR